MPPCGTLSLKNLLCLNSFVVIALYKLLNVITVMQNVWYKLLFANCFVQRYFDKLGLYQQESDKSLDDFKSRDIWDFSALVMNNFLFQSQTTVTGLFLYSINLFCFTFNICSLKLGINTEIQIILVNVFWDNPGLILIYSQYQSPPWY